MRFLHCYSTKKPGKPVGGGAVALKLKVLIDYNNLVVIFF